MVNTNTCGISVAVSSYSKLVVANDDTGRIISEAKMSNMIPGGQEQNVSVEQQQHPAAVYARTMTSLPHYVFPIHRQQLY